MKILIVKIGAIGDVVMSLPMLTAIEAYYPGAEVTWICGKTVAPILQNVPHIQNKIIIDDNLLLKGNLFQKFSALFQVWKRTFFKKYDLILNGHADSRYQLLSLFTFSKIKRKFTRDDSKRGWPVPGRRHTYEYARLVHNVDEASSLKFPFPSFVKKGEQELKTWKKSLGNTPLIAISPGGAKNILREDSLKRWPIENYAGLIQLLNNEGIKPVITGAPSDSWVLQYLSNLQFTNKIGELSLPELVTFYSVCDLLVTHDSGPMHLGGLAGIPVIGIFGPTSPYSFGPVDERSTILWGGAELSCRPCYDGKTYACCNDNICMKGISVSQVYSSIINSLDKNKVN